VGVVEERRKNVVNPVDDVAERFEAQRVVG
jgi:hypothetical protein